MKSKYLIEIIEISLLTLFIAGAIVILTDAISDTNKIVIKQERKIQNLRERVEILETQNKLYEYDLEQINKYHNSETD